MVEPLSDMTASEKADLHEILLSLRLLRSNGGWGSVTVELKGGDLDEIRNEITLKPRLKKSASQIASRPI